MLKPIFDEDVDFFSKKIILCAKGGDFKKGALDSDFMFVTIEPYRGWIPNFVHHVIFLYILSTYITLYTQNQLIWVCRALVLHNQTSNLQ